MPIEWKGQINVVETRLGRVRGRGLKLEGRAMQKFQFSKRKAKKLAKKNSRGTGTSRYGVCERKNRTGGGQKRPITTHYRREKPASRGEERETKEKTKSTCMKFIAETGKPGGEGPHSSIQNIQERKRREEVN